MKIVILDAKTLGEDVDVTIFKQYGYCEVFQTTTLSQRIEHIGDAKIVLTNKVLIDKEVMDACPNMGLICITATGMNNVDLAYAKERGISVKNVAGYSTASVTQATFTLALSLLAQAAYYDHYVKSGEWSKSDIFTHLARPIVEIKGKRWGIIGLGSIGKEVAKVAAAFGAHVVYYSTSGQDRDTQYERMDLERLLRECDIVSIHAPLNEATKGLIGKEALDWMKKGALLLNMGRGGIVDEAALAEAIDTKALLVGLDVVEKEPISADNPLLHVRYKDRLAMSPHTAWASVEARRELVRLVSENIKSYLGG